MSARTVVIGSAVVLVAAVAVVALTGSSKKIEVDYVGGEVCATVPDEVTIYTDQPSNSFKRKKVKWVVDKSLGFEWTFQHKGGGTNLLGGPFVIESDKSSTKSGTSTEPGSWEYAILRNQEPCVDPLVIINR